MSPYREGKESAAAEDQETLDLAPLQALLADVYGGPVRWYAQPMAGGASRRVSVRIHLPDHQTSAVAFSVPNDGRSDEIDPVDSRAWPTCPFVEVHRLLQQRGVRVPSVLADASKEAGWVLVEDLGDTTLAVYLREHPEQKEHLYQMAVRDLVTAQHALASLPPDSLVARRVFDENVLRCELDHFREWAVEGRGHSLSPADRKQFDELATRLAQRIAQWPQRFVHRDYQSRNLMVRQEGSGHVSLVWIDFQDALCGPYLYDLVALLNDSSQTFERPFIEARLEEFAAAAGLEAAVTAEIGRHFDWLTVQRKLKDAGRFVHVAQAQGNASFLPFVDTTLKRAFASLERLADEEDARNLTVLLRRVLSS